MSQVCSQCSRINPPDATYCYWDGAILAGRAGAGPINAGSAPFPNQFIFPSGKMCRNFDQLATTCQQNWQEAVDLLKQGFLATFLGGLGRADLAMAANEAAKFPDPDRGLDMLLSRLPTQVLQPPKLKVEPSEVNLGQLRMGTDRNLELHLSNLGMRLLYGSVSSDSKWLTFGEGAGASGKLFQFGHEAVIQVHVKGQHLRAGNQPLEGQLVVESNGGQVTVTVRADVPITPFTEGVLAGSYTPRQIAEKARAHPKEAAALFERGLVAQWFAQNGWIYPVQGPTVAGMGGVQQFFEALGLAKPPRVELKTPAVHLRGNVGQQLSATIEVTTPERKQVYAWALSDQPWVDVSRTRSEGRNATITANITVPYAPGQTLQANITVTGNGNQRFQVPLTLTVGNTVPPNYQPAQAIPALASAPIMATLAEEPVTLPAAGAPVMAAPVMAAPVMAEAVTAAPANPFAGMGGGPPPLPASPVVAGPPPVPPLPAPAPTYTTPAPAEDELIAPRKKRDRFPFWVHLIPLGALAIALLALMLRDLLGTPTAVADSGEGGPIDPTQRLALFWDFGKEKDVLNTMRFGLVMVDAKNPNNPSPKRLTYDHRGRTNSTVVQIDGAVKGFGRSGEGKWTTLPEDLPPILMTLDPKKPRKQSPGKTATWQFIPDPIKVTQTVHIAPGEAVEVTPGEYKRQLDTCVIKYRIENGDNKAHKIGLRVMVDTLIGMNDGVPFTIPGQPGLVSTFKDYTNRNDIPDFIQALEEPNLDTPGTTVQMNLKLSEKLAPDRVSLTYWPGNKSGLWNWDVPIESIAPQGAFGADSCIVLYWNPVDMKPGEVRECGFSYGLGSLTLKGGRLGITVGGKLYKGGELTVVGYIADPAPGQTASIEFLKDDGKGKLVADNSILQLLPDSLGTQTVTPQEKGADGKTRPSPVTWRVRVLEAGTPTILVRTSAPGQPPLEQTRKLTIKKKGIF